MNFANAKHLTIDGKNVVRLKQGDNLLWKGLPAGYTELDYIETTGTQYIDTGFIPNQDSRIVCEFMYFEGNGIYGARDTTSSRNFALRVASDDWQTCYGAMLYGTGIVADTTDWHVAEQNKNYFYLDGVLRRTCTYAEFTTPYPIILGGIMANKSGAQTLYGGAGRYRATQVYDDGKLVRDLIPCRNPDGEAGMYDLLNAKFYENAGTGDFVVGEVTS